MDSKLSASKTSTEGADSIQQLAAITNNPRSSLFGSIYSLFSESFSDISYTPDMTEESVLPSPLLPSEDPDNFGAYYRSLSKVRFSP